jgi:hypothetical protein
MTTIISRLYTDAGTAKSVAADLAAAGFPASAVDVIHAGDGMAAAMAAARVPADSVNAYGAVAGAGNAAVVVRAEVTPMGAALRAMQIVDGHASINVPGADPNAYDGGSVRYDLYTSILTDHPRWFSSDIRPGSGLGPGLISRAFGLRLLSQHRTSRSAIAGGRFMSRMFWPMPLLSRHKPRTSAMSGGGYMSRWFWPMALVSTKGR